MDCNNMTGFIFEKRRLNNGLSIIIIIINETMLFINVPIKPKLGLILIGGYLVLGPITKGTTILIVVRIQFFHE